MGIYGPAEQQLAHQAHTFQWINPQALKPLLHGNSRKDLMAVAILVISSLCFVGGIVAYWICSKPLAELPTLNEIMAAKEKEG